jgi:hypothetical protein
LYCTESIQCTYGLLATRVNVNFWQAAANQQENFHFKNGCYP